MHELAPLIADLALILCVAGVVTLICQKIKQPVVLGYLVAGLIVGPYTPPSFYLQDPVNTQVLAELGVIFLMFALGLEFSFHKLKQVGAAALITALVEVLVMLGVGFGIGEYLGWSNLGSLFLGAALSISSTTIIVKALDELGLKSERFAQLILAILIVEDLLAILLLVLLTTMSSGSHSGYGVISDLTKLVLVVGSWFLVGYFIIPTVMRKVIGFISNETLTVVALGLCLMLAAVAAHFHYSVALGAFMMGSLLAETTLGVRILHRIEPIRDMFAAVFFVTVGTMIDPKVILLNWKIVLLITLVTIVGKWLASSFGALISGRDTKNALQVGMGMAQIGEFSFIIVGLGLALNVVEPSLQPVIVAVSVLTTFATPYGIKYSERLSTNMAALLPARFHHQLLLFTQRRHKFLTGLTQMSPALSAAWARFLINALLIAIIFSSSAQVLFHWLNATHNWLALGIAWFITWLCAAPFLWAMLFAFINVFKGVAKAAILSVAWIIVLLELAFLSEAYFEVGYIALCVVLLSSLGVVAFAKILAQVYFWFARQFVANWEEGGKHASGS